MAQDPVCHMSVDESKAAAKAYIMGRLIIFVQKPAKKGLTESLKNMLKKQEDMNTAVGVVINVKQ